MIIEFLGQVHGLTKVDEALRDYILNNPEKIENLKINDFKNICHVGVASVNRFCKKIGYKGYREFKMAFVKEYTTNEKVNTVLKDEPFNENSSYEDVLRYIPYVYEKAIGFAQAAIDEKVLNRIINYLQTSNVIIVATGINKCVADMFSYKLEELGINCKTFDSIHFQYIDTLRLKKEKMFGILLSHTGENPSVIQAAKFLYRRNIKSLLICNSVDDNLRGHCSEVLKIIPTLNTKELSSIQYSISMQYILDVFVASLLIKNYKYIKEVGENSNYYKKDK